MFVFLLSLKHPETANNYQRVEELLELTLRSICGQSCAEFRVVVVCNKVPQINFSDDRVHFHVVDYPAVSKSGGKLDKEEKFTDKGTKYMSGLLFAKQFAPKYVYIFDSDDWVNRNLVSYMKSAPDYPLWCVDKGYFVNFESKEYKKRSGLLRYCGSTFIYDYNFLMREANVQGAIDEKSSQKELIEATSHHFIVKLLSNHTINYVYFKDKGIVAKPIPLRTACWIQGTGENVSNTAGGYKGLSIDDEFCHTFSLPDSCKSKDKAEFSNWIRDLFAGIYSSLTWYYSKYTGKRVF
ncbi:glycosyltransferase family A protein [Hahella ganghwensis]|uniref:glycosyltransferase family A protein n=1 Tax=Hahella ganghwensis TaxID=286420 RepID=UPI00035ED16D|nr:glycosyltransferase family A protein [Hahella ganghwensis]